MIVLAVIALTSFRPLGVSTGNHGGQLLFFPVPVAGVAAVVRTRRFGRSSDSGGQAVGRVVSGGQCRRPGAMKGAFRTSGVS
jgi:hypothetical protein